MTKARNLLRFWSSTTDAWKQLLTFERTDRSIESVLAW